ncbi:MAG: group I truncated hemoglobin [Acidimicrobiales bacterium]
MAGDETGGAAAPDNHYDRLGGGAAVLEAVDRFYALVLADDELAPYFTDVDIARLKRHQVLLLSQVLGGPTAYDGRELGDAHRGLGVTDAHYDKVVAHLVSVLTELGADDEAIAAAGSVVAAVRPDIVESTADGGV